ncbi:hypothetical protein [Fodinibius sp.]|uniref:hypothetical protein n=1 Tax=Fodinibius sp. TaxID=1872440 RepID=UPI002ACDA0E6|nr:hypothetical protein [Fodinibius sp.]MDZ7657997.1 hypothetical protein [Fodinibius sp.]
MHADPTRKELVTMVQQIRSYCDLLEHKIDQIKPEKEWLTTAEFAEKAELKLKTVSNYCGQDKYQRMQKNDRGKWEIHKSELP